MAEYSEIILETRNSVATITLNRPDRLNAWTGIMQAELKDAIFAAGSNDDIGCIVVTGAGRGFCAGADMEVLREIEPSQGGSDDEGLSTAFADAPGPDVAPHFAGRFGYLYSCPKPVIAAINGPCAGVGFVFALYADMRFAASDAKFTTAFSKIGLIAEHGMSLILPRLVGEAHALDILFTARTFLGDEAERMGVVNKAMPGDELMPFVESLTKQMAEHVSPRSIAVMKRQVRAAYFQNFEEALATADAEMRDSLAAADFKEGVAAFVERRPPNFAGN
ncbi:MAG: enoyl-CoA hydratase [Sphingomonadaceae bacterium]|nr:enoyl-CoA hydratase [Sphingomonadaceae bacterium]